MKNIKGIWFYGLSGSGKTTALKFIKKKLNSIICSLTIDGDLVRKNVSFDLNYSKRDRIIQITRVLGISKLAIQSNIFPIASTVYLNKKIQSEAKKIGICVYKIVRSKKEIYKNNSTYKNKKNVVGVDIFYLNLKNKTIYNKTKKKFLLNLSKIVNKIIQKNV